MVARSSLRSSLVPTRMIGTLGAWCSISGNHCGALVQIDLGHVVDRISGRKHLSLDVVERGRADDGEADKEDVGLGVRQGAKSVVIFLSSSIPKS